MVDFVRPVTQMAAFEKMIDLDVEVGVSVVKTMAGLIFEIDGNGRDTEIDLIDVPLQLGAVGPEIRSLEIIVFFLVPRLVDVVTEEQYPWILYYKFWQLY